MLYKTNSARKKEFPASEPTECTRHLQIGRKRKKITNY